MTGYIENSQFDAEECMTHVINLFYPRIDNTNHPDHNKVPKDCLFHIDSGESVFALIVTNHQINSIQR